MTAMFTPGACPDNGPAAIRNGVPCASRAPGKVPSVVSCVGIAGLAMPTSGRSDSIRTFSWRASWTSLVRYSGVEVAEGATVQFVGYRKLVIPPGVVNVWVSAPAVTAASLAVGVAVTEGDGVTLSCSEASAVDGATAIERKTQFSAPNSGIFMSCTSWGRMSTAGPRCPRAVHSARLGRRARREAGGSVIVRGPRHGAVLRLLVTKDHESRCEALASRAATLQL